MSKKELERTVNVYGELGVRMRAGHEPATGSWSLGYTTWGSKRFLLTGQVVSILLSVKGHILLAQPLNSVVVAEKPAIDNL